MSYGPLIYCKDKKRKALVGFQCLWRRTVLTHNFPNHPAQIICFTKQLSLPSYVWAVRVLDHSTKVIQLFVFSKFFATFFTFSLIFLL